MAYLLLASVLASSVSAYPSVGNAVDKRQTGDPLPNAFINPNPGWSPSQLIDVTGAHAFVAPNLAGGDIRGPCPGLNALANHGYLPHNGVATITQFIEATNSVYGMGVDLGGFLAVFGAVFDGDGLEWSIGGPPPSSLTNLAGGLLGYPQGISGSHNKYESDASPTRGDLYQYGDDYNLQMSQFNELYAYQADDPIGDYTLDMLQDYRGKRFNEQVAANPYFFSGPFTGVLVAPAAFSFIYRFFANKTQERPEGILTKEVLKSFFAVSGPDDALVHTPGAERIPENWYRRAVDDQYTIPGLNSDTVNNILKFPQTGSVGGNTGTVNTFTGVDPANLSGGIFDSASLLQNNNLFCFAYQNAVQAQPDISLAVVTTFADAIGSAISALNCPTLKKIDDSQFNAYPGYTNLKKGGVY